MVEERRLKFCATCSFGSQLKVSSASKGCWNNEAKGDFWSMNVHAGSYDISAVH